MGIFNIKSITYIPKPGLDEIVSYLLSTNKHDDYIFDHVFFKIILDKNAGNIVNYLYRLLWESSYIKSSKMSNTSNNTDDIEIYISLSEAIAIIMQCTPPLLASRISEGTKSIPDIIDTLKVFLMEESKELTHYQSIFKKHIHLEVFNTIENNDLSRLDYLKDTNCGKMYLITANTSFDGVINPKSKEHPMAFLMVKISDAKQLNIFYTLINTVPCAVTNVTVKDTIIYVRLFVYDSNVDAIIDRLKISYNK